MTGKAFCYKCKYRRDVLGSAHSSCAHPEFGFDENDSTGILLSLLSSGIRLPRLDVPETPKVKLNQHGVDEGWANHPYNFDPVWVEECDGFEKREE